MRLDKKKRNDQYKSKSRRNLWRNYHPKTCRKDPETINKAKKKYWMIETFQMEERVKLIKKSRDMRTKSRNF